MQPGNDMTVLTEIRPGSRFQILALDGGGIKGIFSAAFLAALEDAGLRQ